MSVGTDVSRPFGLSIADKDVIQRSLQAFLLVKSSLLQKPTGERSLWESTGLELLTEVLRRAKEHGAAQSVVVCGHLDQPKRTLLDQMGYSIASEWYVHNL